MDAANVVSRRKRGKVVAVDGPNCSGKTTLFNNIIAEMKKADPAIRIKTVSVKDFLSGESEELVSKYKSYNKELFTQEELMRIMQLHVHMYYVIDNELEHELYDVVLIDRSIASFIIYNLEPVVMLDDDTLNKNYDSNAIYSYLYREVTKYIDKLKVIYAYVTFQGCLDGDMDSALSKTVERIKARGVEQFDLSKMSNNLIAYNEFHAPSMCYSLNGLPTGEYKCSEFSYSKIFFKDTMCITSNDHDKIIDKLTKEVV